MKKSYLNSTCFHVSIWALVILLTSAFTSWKSPESINRILKVDALGYYSYLPAIFIHKDIKFNYYDAIFQSDLNAGKKPFDFREETTQGIINKYYIGTALCQLPFFLPVYAYYSIQNMECTGYENAFQIAIHISAIFYFLLGLVCILKLAQLFNLSKNWAIILAYAILLGTNAGYLVVSEPGLSHIYSFFWVAIFLYGCKKIFLSESNKATIFLVGISLGMILLIRPVNLIILMAIPFLAGDIKTIFTKKNIQYSFIIGLLSMLIVSIQAAYYYASTNTIFIYSYNEETFDFLNAHFFEFLWSYQKGFFLYTPLFLFLFASFILALQKKLYKESMYFALFFILLTYIFSSWWLWHYGGGLGTRVYVEFYPLFIIPIIWYFTTLKSEFIKTLSILFLGIFVYFGQITHWQYRMGKIHWDSATKEEFINNLFRIDHLL